jgi:hypothetical protein
MPLAFGTLQSELETLFASPPATIADCAQGWADAVESYATGIIPASTTVTSAAATLSTALAAAFALPAAAPAMDTAFTAFSVAVGAGMAGYTPTPPVAALGIPTLIAPPYPTTHAAAATEFATLIDTWMRTGFSTLIAAPFTVVPWS